MAALATNLLDVDSSCEEKFLPLEEGTLANSAVRDS